MTAIATLPVLLQQGTHGARPAASAVGSGALYFCTTHSLIYQQLTGAWGTFWTFSSGFADPMTSRGDIIIRNASNVTARLAIGSSGKVLSSDGTDISWQTPAGGGALTLLEQHTGSGAGTLDFTTFISSTYDEYLFEIVDLLMTTDNSNLLMRFGTGGGPTYDTTNHSTDGMIFRNGASGTYGGTALGGIELDDPGGGVDNSTAADAFNGTLRLFNPQSSSHWKRVDGQTSYRNNFGPSRIGTMIRGSYESTTAVTAIRFMSDGASPNIASGTIRVYGLAK